MLQFKLNTEGTKRTRGKRKRETERLQQLNKGVRHVPSKRKRKNSNHAKQGRCIECKVDEKSTHTSLICSRCSCFKKNEQETFVCKKHWKEHLERHHKS